MESKIKVGDKAPDFRTQDQRGGLIRLSEYLGKKNVVLYFYPKDFTSGCTAEACSFRDNYEVFLKAGAEVIGVSGDSEDSHLNFTTEHKLPFVLLSDKNGELRQSYGVSPPFGNLPNRTTFIIDKKGIVRYIFSSLPSATDHVTKAMEVLREIG